MINEMRALKRIKCDLKNILQVAPVLKHAKGAGRIFELYIMMRVAKALKDDGWTVEPLASNGNMILTPALLGIPQKHLPFIQRGGAPTGIVPTSLSDGPSSIKISRNGKSYEILNGVQFRGRSGALHELDISIVPHELVNNLRAGTSVGFPFGRAQIAIECKDVGSVGSPDEMRSVVARMYDLTILDAHLSYLNLPNNGFIFDSPAGAFAEPVAPKTYLDSNIQSLSVLARRSGLSSGAIAMTGLYRIQPYINVTHPSTSSDQLVDDVVNWINFNL